MIKNYTALAVAAVLLAGLLALTVVYVIVPARADEAANPRLDFCWSPACQAVLQGVKSSPAGVKTAPGLPGGATPHANYGCFGTLCTVSGNPNLDGSIIQISVSPYVEDIPSIE